MVSQLLELRLSRIDFSSAERVLRAQALQVDALGAWLVWRSACVSCQAEQKAYRMHSACMSRLAQLIQGRAALAQHCIVVGRSLLDPASAQLWRAQRQPAAQDVQTPARNNTNRSVTLRLHPTGSVDRVSAPCCRWPGAVASRQCCHPLSQPLCCCDLSRSVRGGGGSTFRDADSPGPQRDAKPLLLLAGTMGTS